LLKALYNAFVNGDESVKSDVRSFNTLLDAWSKSGSSTAPRRAEQILSRMLKHLESGVLDTKPDFFSYTPFIKCWAKSRQQEGVEREESVLVLREMQNRYKACDEVLKPSVITYNSVINAYAKKGNAERAEALLEEMHNAFVNGNESMKANVRFFATTLDAWSKSARSTSFWQQCANTLNQATSIPSLIMCATPL
jgi:pentatricopeptide repeat protein